MPGAIRQRRRGSSCLTLSATAIRNQQSKEVDMGHSLRKFMESVGMPISGPKRQGNHRPGEKHRRGLDHISATGARKESACAREFIASRQWTSGSIRTKDKRRSGIRQWSWATTSTISSRSPICRSTCIMLSGYSVRPRRMDLYLFLCQPHTADSTREAGAYSARRSAADLRSGYRVTTPLQRAPQGRPESNSEGVSKI